MTAGRVPGWVPSMSSLVRGLRGGEALSRERVSSEYIVHRSFLTAKYSLL